MIELGYLVWDLDPNIFPFTGLFRWYSIMWVIGIVIAYNLVQKRRAQIPLEEKEVEKLSFFMLLGAIIGARLGHILFYDPMHYLENPVEILPIRTEPTFEFVGFMGLASHGGTVGGFLMGYLFARKKSIPLIRILDAIVVPGIVLGGFIRLGNFFNSEIIGIPSDSLWAVVFTNVDLIPRHPAQLYEALAYFFTALLLCNIKKLPSGAIFGLGVSLVFIERFFIEFLKENQVQFEDSMVLNMGQLLSIPIAIAGIAILFYAISKRRRLEADSNY